MKREELKPWEETRFHHEQLKFKFMAEIQKLPAKQSIRGTKIAAAHDIRLQQLQDLAIGGDPDVVELAKADIFSGFGGQADAE